MDKQTPHKKPAAPHSFHIPVMGSAFTIDTPLKVAKYGISSVISLVDDALIEEMRKFYSHLTGETYAPITKYDEDHRARRITEYLNLVDKIVKKQFEELRKSAFEAGSEITKYFRMLSERSELKQLYNRMCETDDADEKKAMQDELRQSIKPGSIDVNIMTKLDRDYFGKDGNELPEMSDALAALRGYAKSTLESAIVFSAGINRRLYSYVEKFKDFYADASGNIKKKIVLKVSDYRSTIIQGKFFAKKGIWVSEYRVESGLNCGGHAFATDGYLMGPILEEFKSKRDELIQTLHKLYTDTLAKKDLPAFEQPRDVKITAQGGIGTVAEQNFLMDYYCLDGTGWATPFLLVPEVTNVDKETLIKLAGAREDDLYLSPVSPLGVPFNNLRNSFSDMERDKRVQKGRPGSACPKGHLVSNTEFTEKPICTASRQYQKLKLEQVNEMKLNPENHNRAVQKVISKSCICNDLGEPALIKNNIGNGRPKFSAICPGPNMAYFSKIATLEEMIDHIYGRIDLRNSTYRPNMFIKELKMYVEYFTKETQKVVGECTEKQRKYLEDFRINLLEGIDYYRELFPQIAGDSIEMRDTLLAELQNFKDKLDDFVESHPLFNTLPESSTITASAS